MNRRVAIICFGFQTRQLRSQPWHMADGLAKGLMMEGFSVKLFTDTDDVPGKEYAIRSVKQLFHRHRPSKCLVNSMNDFQPKLTFVFIGSHELLTPKRFDLPGEVHLVVCNARFTVSELSRTSVRGYWFERSLLVRPVLSSLIPGWLLKRGFKKSRAKGMVYVSAAAQQRYAKLGLPNGKLFIPSVDKSYIQSNTIKKIVATEKIICYFGPPLQLRGADLTISAFEDAFRKVGGLRLKLLLRLNGEPYIDSRYENICKRASASKYCNYIEIVAEYLSASELKSELDQVDVFLLPFKMTVSDSPLVVIEAGLAGKPVVALKTPGVDEFVDVFGGISVSKSKELGDGVIRALTSTPVIVGVKPWVDWTHRVKPLIEGLLHE